MFRTLVFGLFSFVGLVVVSGCAPFPRPVSLKTAEVDEYEIVGINPPKHFYLHLKNVRTGEVHRSVYISKHYNNHRKIAVGTKITLTKSVWLYDDGSERYSFDKNEIRAALDKIGG